MVLGKECRFRAEKKSAKWPKCRFAVLAILLGLAACNPVEAWRDLTGASRNDPDPDTTPNTGNLAAGEAADYPNLATVPPPPIRAMTAADREKLTQSLIADRANARHSDEQLRAGFTPPSAGPPSPPPPALPSPSTSDLSQSGAGARGPASAPSAAAAPLVAPSAASASRTASAATSTGTAALEAAAVPAATPPSRRTGGKASAEPGQGLRKQGEPPQPGPMESSLEMPQTRSTPQPEQIQPAPPPPQLAPTPRVASTLPSGLSAGGALARTAPPEAAAPAGFQPAPAAPELPPLPPPQSEAAASGKPRPKTSAPTSALPVAEVKFHGDSTALEQSARETLATVVPLYEQNPGKIRIVGYAGAGSGAVEQLNSYRTALDRAQAVAAALSQAGIPSDKIQVEAAPAGTNSGESRAEVLIEH